MPIEPDDIFLAHRIAAQIVARDGEAFLPIFLRLEAEVEAIAGRRSAIERARALLADQAA